MKFTHFNSPGVATKTPAETFKTGSFEKVSVSSIAEFSDFIEKNGCSL